MVTFLAAIVATKLTAGAVAPQFFDFFADPGDPTFAPSLKLTDSNAATILTQLQATPVGQRAVLIMQPLTTGYGLFDQVAVDKVFVDVEFLASATKFKNIATAISGSLLSSSAHVGNWQMFPHYPDTTRPDPFMGSVNVPGYLLSGATMANPSLYPGSPNFRNPANGNSTAPNIRSGLFTLPILRLSATSDGLQSFPTGHTNIPYVTRFNNFGNGALDNDDSDPNYLYKWDTTLAGPNGEDYTDQLLSRGDFAALVAHYRARGADSLITFGTGVIGYTDAEMRSDITTGWGLFDVVDPNGTAKAATLQSTVALNGVTSTIEETGVVWSGMHEDDVLHVLLSNLSEKTAEVAFSETVDSAFFLPADKYDIKGGQHLFIEYFKGEISGVDFWLRARVDDLGGSDSAGGSLGLDFNRNGMGVPEPATLLLLAFGSVALLSRRRH